MARLTAVVQWDSEEHKPASLWLGDNKNVISTFNQIRDSPKPGRGTWFGCSTTRGRFACCTTAPQKAGTSALEGGVAAIFRLCGQFLVGRHAARKFAELVATEYTSPNPFNAIFCDSIHAWYVSNERGDIEIHGPRELHAGTYTLVGGTLQGEQAIRAPVSLLVSRYTAAWSKREITDVALAQAALVVFSSPTNFSDGTSSVVDTGQQLTSEWGHAKRLELLQSQTFLPLAEQPCSTSRFGTHGICVAILRPHCGGLFCERYLSPALVWSTTCVDLEYNVHKRKKVGGANAQKTKQQERGLIVAVVVWWCADVVTARTREQARPACRNDGHASRE